MNIFRTAATVMALLLASLANAASQQPVKVDITGQSMDKALDQFAHQTGLQVVFSNEDVARGLKAPAVNGTYTPEAILTRLLENSGLRFEFLNDRTVAIRSAKAEGESSSSQLRPADQMRMANSTSSGDTVESDGASAPQDEKKNQITVAGEHERRKPFSTANIDLTRTTDDILPFNIFSSKDIELSGATDLAEFLRNRLPQNFPTAIAEEAEGDLDTRGGGAPNRINIRGWGGVGETEVLVLLNGRRLPAQFIGIAADSKLNPLPNFRNIPIGAIERIEVLSSAASAIYGASATGGVINIITRQDYKGGQVSLGYENPLDTDAPKKTADLVYTLPLHRNLTGRIVLGYSEKTPLTWGEREDVSVSRWRRTIWERAPSIFTDNTTPPLGATTNIRSVSGAPLFGSGTANFTSVPVGYVGGQGLAPFLQRQGVYNLDLAEGGGASGNDQSSSRFGTIGPPETQKRGGVGFDYRVADGWDLSVDFTRGTDEFEGHSYGRVGGNDFIQFIVLASAAVNPFGQNVRVTMDDSRLNRPELKRAYQSVTDQFTSYLRGDWGRWRAMLDFNWVRNENEFHAVTFGGTQGRTNNTGFALAVRDGLYNPFVDARVAAPAAPSFYEDYIQNVIDESSEYWSYQTSVKLSGPAWRLPAGDMQLTAGLDWMMGKRARAESSDLSRNSITHQAIVVVDNTPPFSIFESRGIAAYAELTAPIFKRERKLFRSLEIFGSGRMGREKREGVTAEFLGLETTDNINYEQAYSTPRAINYDTSPHVFAGGMKLGIADHLSLRASRSVGFQPPSLLDISSALNPTSSIGVEDRRQNDLPVTLAGSQYLIGGNPGLKPETTSSTNYGAIVQIPTRGTRISLDYVESIRNDAITSLDVQTVLDLEVTDASMVQYVSRDPAGQIVFVDARTRNFREISSRSADLLIEQRIGKVGKGRIVLNAAATKNLSFSVQPSATSSAVEQVRNRTGAFNQVLKWNGNVQVRWESDSWTYGWATRYYDFRLVNPDSYVRQGSDRVPRALEHDAFMSYRFANPNLGTGNIFSGMFITCGIKNVFDREPRYVGATEAPGYERSDSLYGRTFWLQLRAQL